MKKLFLILFTRKAIVYDVPDKTFRTESHYKSTGHCYPGGMTRYRKV